MTTTSQLAQEVPALVPPPALYWPTSSPTVPGTQDSMLTGEAALSAVSFKNIRNPNPILFRSVQSVLLQPQTNLTVINVRSHKSIFGILGDEVWRTYCG